MFTRIPTLDLRKLLLPAVLMVFTSIAACGSDETTASDAPEIADTAETDEGAGSAEQSDGESETTSSEQVDQATAFWEAVAADDRETALGFIGAAAEPEDMLFGRAGTLPGQFEWYEAVGLSWELEGCDAAGAATVDCDATARNRWSDALGVDPVTGTFTLWFGEDGIVSIVDKNDSFVSQWGPMVFAVFARWVDENHPEDARIMFGDDDVNPEILGLYATNSDRFVEAQQNP